MSVPRLDPDALQPTTKSLRLLAVSVSTLLALIVVALILTPWQQNIPARGRVVAFNPLDRSQRIPAPVTGRLVTVRVREGSFVRANDVLIEMADLDPSYQLRLESQVRFAEQKVNAAKESLAFYTRQVANLETSRQMSISVARFEFDMAEQQVRATEQALAAAKADREQKEADAKRQARLYEKEIRSELDYQRAKAAFESADAKVKEMAAKRAKDERGAKAKNAAIRKVENDTQAKLESAKSAREDARSKVAIAEKELADTRTKLARQETSIVRAPRDGVILAIHAAGQADLVKAGQPLIDFVPQTDDLAVELYVRGNDAPLVSPGAPVRINFEGWPAIQFAGWPSVAQGTFGGIVSVVDAHDDGMGRFRILVRPDPNDEPWPDQPFLRQGGRAKGWVLLTRVSLGYELWRQLNGFPPAMTEKPRPKRAFE